jgi:gas vesicle protein
MATVGEIAVIASTAATVGSVAGGLVLNAIKGRAEAGKLGVDATQVTIESAQISVGISREVLEDVYKVLEDVKEQVEQLRKENQHLHTLLRAKEDENTELRRQNITLEEELLRIKLREPRRADDPGHVDFTQPHRRLGEEGGEQ